MITHKSVFYIIMGIPHYFHVLIKTYPNIVRHDPPSKCTDYFLDFNGIIHQSANKVLSQDIKDDGFSETLILEETWNYTQNCVNITRPSNMVHICTDGVAPIAKMNQQRKRRYISILRNKWENTQPVFDRNAISPGTHFMDKMHAYIRKCIRDTTSAIPFYFSTSSDNGEGEHKIFSRISSLPDDSVCIVHGLDADLIILSLLSHRPNIVLMREPSGPMKDLETENGFIYLMIDQLRIAILDDLRTKYKWSITTDMVKNPYREDTNKFIDDYATICFLLGNDFLPHSVSLQLRKNGYERLLVCGSHAYEKHGHLITDDASLNMSYISYVFGELSATEDDDVWKYNEEYMKKHPYENEKDPYDTYPLKNKSKLTYEIYNNKPHKWRSLYYKYLFNTRLHDTSVIATSCTLYVQGLLWTYRYYKRMQKDPLWYYPYGYPPTFRDLANYTSSMTAADLEQLWSKFIKPPHMGFVHPYVQLLCIMPIESANILPVPVREAMTKNKACAHMFPIKYDVETYMKYHLWECVPTLPFLDIDCFEQCIGKELT